MGKESNEQSSSSSWWLGSHNHPNQSQWLQSTLSDLDKKVKTIMNVLEDDGDSFAKRADVYFQRRPELIKMVEDLHKSYRSMALKLDQLRPESSSTEAANSFRKFQNLQIGRSESAELLRAPKPHPELDGLEEEREEMWEELREKVAKLIDENLRYQAELIRRNDEKRKAITVLCARIGRLVEENRALKSCVAHSVVDSRENQSNLSRMKGAILGKLLR